MIPKGDTKSHLVRDWAHNQAAYLGPHHLLLLLVLTKHAFVREDNPENAPVGQVMETYSSSAALAAWTSLGRSTVLRLLASLQFDHGYITRVPRAGDGKPGNPPSTTRVYWTTEDDMIRASFRAGKIALPDVFDPPPPKLRLVDFKCPTAGQSSVS